MPASFENDPSALTGFLITLFAVISIALSFANSRLGSIALEVLNRWVRWVLFSFGVAYFIKYSEMSDRPYWLLVLSSFLGWLLIETLYNWITVSLLSKSDFPLFPKYQLNRDNDEWPNQPRFIKIREWLRANQFSSIQHLKSYLIEEISIRSSFYESEDKKIRVQVMFVPQRTGALSSCFICSSQSSDGTRLITDNVYLPFGGIYPEKWHLVRKPMSRSLPKLIELHKKRMSASSEEWISMDYEPLDDLNKSQNLLEEVNVREGLMNPKNLHEEHGKISQEGRYRIWKEVWLLNYLGTSVNYQKD